MIYNQRGERKVNNLLLPQSTHHTLCILDNRLAISPLTCKVEDFRPLLADVDTDVRPSYSQVGTTLIKHKGLHLKQKMKNEIQIDSNLCKIHMKLEPEGA